MLVAGVVVMCLYVLYLAMQCCLHGVAVCGLLSVYPGRGAKLLNFSRVGT